MEQSESISMSSVIATMLLKSKVVTCLDIAMVCSKLSLMEVYVDDENDCNIDYLLSFVDIGDVIKIKDSFSYGTLINRVCIFDILTNLSDSRVEFVMMNETNNSSNDEVSTKNTAVKKLRRKPMFGRFSFGMF